MGFCTATSLKPKAVSCTHQQTHRLQDGPKKRTQYKGFGLVKSLTWGELINRTTLPAELWFSAFPLQQVQMFVPLGLVPCSPKPAMASQPSTSPKNGSADVATAANTCPSKQVSMPGAHNPRSPFPARFGVFMPNHQALKPPKSCTTAGRERRPNELEQIVLWFKLAPQHCQQCYGSLELNSNQTPSPATSICSTWGQATALLPLLNSSKWEETSGSGWEFSFWGWQICCGDWSTDIFLI